VADRDDITALVHHYGELLDAGDIDGVVALFSRATWRSAATGAVLSTPEEIRGVYENIAMHDGSPRTRHLMTNVVIEMDDGADVAAGRSTYTVLQSVGAGDPIEIVVVGRYEDRYARGPDGWHLTDRLFLVDLQADTSRHFPRPGSSGS
jgi:3-phenylpropionate/cinnamic acid dioxygenase small subunit